MQSCSSLDVSVLTISSIFLDPQLRKCQVSTAMYHFSITFLVLLLCSSHPTFRLFDAKRLPFLPMLPICLFFAGSIVLSNLSLTWNSVGFFQLTKILTTPCVALLGYLMFRIKTNRMRLVAVAACCIGVAMTNTKQAITNPVGAIIATAAFVITALYQIYIGRQMQVLEASAPQLLMNQAPISVFLLAFVLPFFDTTPDSGMRFPRKKRSNTLTASQH
jgi:solute carrier family 35 protein E3